MRPVRVYQRHQERLPARRFGAFMLKAKATELSPALELKRQIEKTGAAPPEKKAS